jgi:GDPmannose 4,6-dehydratase
VSPIALVIGSGGQDGRILAEQLLDQGIRVVGVDVPTAKSAPGVDTRTVALHDRGGMRNLVRETKPSEIYYLAAFHHAATERDHVDVGELLTRSFEVNVDGLIGVVQAMREHAQTARLFYASSSHVFGAPLTTPQDEATHCEPRSPYAISKRAGMSICQALRDQHGMFAVSGVLYNHESARRGDAFVSTKIVRADS